MLGTVIGSASGARVAVSNFHGSFAVSLYESATGVTKVVTSSCAP
jgi:hypothetical protein